MQNHHSRAAYTLIEILVATAVSMILMLAIMRMFGGIGESLNKSRADMNLALELRRVESILQRDLDNRSITTVTTQVTGGGHGGTNGYFTYQEGPMWTPSDNEPRLATIASGANPPRTADGPNGLAAKVADTSVPDPVLDAVVNSTTVPPLTQRDFFSLNMAATDTSAPDSTVGDLDDQLAFTVENSAVLYRGRGIDPTDGLGTVESSQAEVAWFVRGTTLYRRVLLIDDQAYTKSFAAVNATPPPILTDNRTGVPLTLAILNALWTNGLITTTPPLTFYDIFDLSVRWETGPPNRLEPNLLPHLADRRNRFGCDRGNATPNNPPLPDLPPYPPCYERPTTLGDQCLPGMLTGRPLLGVPASSISIPEIFAVGGDFWDTDASDFLLPYKQDFIWPAASPNTRPRLGEDAVIKNVLSFDVKAWIDNDTSSGTLVPAYFADLGWRGVDTSVLPANLATDPYNDFSYAGRYAGDTPNVNRPLNTAQMSCIYDTWWTDTPAPPEPPYGNSDNTSPHTPATLKAIQVTIRVFEPQFRTVQEVRVVKRLE